MYSANETYYSGTQSSFTTCCYLCRAPHSKGDRLSVREKEEVFCSRTSWLLWRNLSSTAWRKNRLYIQSRLCSAFLRKIFMACLLAAKIGYEYCKSQVTFERYEEIPPFLRLLITFCLLKSFIAGPMGNRA